MLCAPPYAMAVAPGPRWPSLLPYPVVPELPSEAVYHSQHHPNPNPKRKWAKHTNILQSNLQLHQVIHASLNDNIPRI